MKERQYGILIHGGAGSNKNFSINEQTEKIKKIMETTARSAFNILENNTNSQEKSEDSDNRIYPTRALDAVESAVVAMENSGLFDAGINGSYLTLNGKIEMDAAIMNGKDLAAGAVGMVQNIRNPISLARLVMEKTDHIMLVGEGALELAKTLNIEICNVQPTEKNLLNYTKFLEKVKSDDEKLKEEYPKNYKYFHHLTNKNGFNLGTVGAVAIDTDGNVASAVSTGGRAFKMHGRIGDSSIIGSGLYADNEFGATCVTAYGEYIMRICLAKTTCDYLKIQDSENKRKGKIDNNALIASRKAIERLTSKFGYDTGGLISVDKHGNFGAYANTKSMPIAFLSNITDKVKVGFNNEDFEDLFYR